MKGTLSEVNVFNNLVSTETGEKQVNTNIQWMTFNGVKTTRLSIFIINSPLNEQNADARGHEAEKISSLAFTKFPSINKVDSIDIHFMRHKQFLIFQSNISVGGYHFNVDHRPPATSVPASS